MDVADTFNMLAWNGQIMAKKECAIGQRFRCHSFPCWGDDTSESETASCLQGGNKVDPVVRFLRRFGANSLNSDRRYGQYVTINGIKHMSTFL